LHHRRFVFATAIGKSTRFFQRWNLKTLCFPLQTPGFSFDLVSGTANALMSCNAHRFAEPTKEPSMSTTTQNRSRSNFYNQQLAEIWIVTIGALAVIVFLSTAFYLYDTNKIETPAVQVVPQVQNQANPGDLVAVCKPMELLNRGTVLVRDTVGWSSNFAIAAINLGAVVSPENTMWRYTTDGWKDISLMAEQNQPTQSPLETVHPVIWTALTLLGVLLLLVMASSEREVNKLLKRDTVVKNGKV
jgi:hypothetical protein